MLACLPAHAYYGSLVSNDSLSWLLAAAALDGLRRGHHLRADREARLRLVLFLAAGLLCKSSGLLLLPLLWLEPLRRRLRAWRRGERDPYAWVRSALGPALICLAALALAAPWYWRDYRLYGNWLALEAGSGPARNLSPAAWPGAAWAWMEWTTATFWFPWNLRFAFRSLFEVLAMADAALFIALLGAALDGARRRGALCWTCLALAACGYGDFFLRFGQAEARLAFVAAAPLAALAARGAGALGDPGAPGRRLGNWAVTRGAGLQGASRTRPWKALVPWRMDKK